jgi:tungstate transport system ATP-binding protein
MSFIELKGISKRYGNIMALDNVTLDVNKGEIFAVMGNSGAGKTTLLKILALLEKQSNGSYYYEGEEVRGNEDRLRRKITMVFQKPVMFNTSVYNNVAYGLKLRGFRKDEVKRRVREALNLVKLQDYEKYNAKKLSGGEQQRVAIARALVLNPELLIMDEPTANLDPANVIIIEKVMKEIVREGTTIVLATHNLFQAKRLSNRVIHLFEGKSVEIGETKSVFENPKSEITRKFVNGELFF